MDEYRLSEEEFEEIKNVERDLAGLKGTPLEIKLVPGPLLLLLAPPALAPADDGLSCECELLLANAGAQELRVDRIATKSAGLNLELPDLPFALEAHSCARRIHLTFAGAGLAGCKAIPLKFYLDEEEVAEFLIETVEAGKLVARSLENSIPFMDAIANGEIEAFPGVLDFGDVPFWGDVNLHLVTAKAETLEVIGEIAASGQKSFGLDENMGEWRGVFAFPEGKHRYYFKIDDCVTLDPSAANEIEIGQQGIYSIRTVQHYTRFLKLRNVFNSSRTLEFSSGQEWIIATPASLTLAAGESAQVAIKIAHEKMPLGKFGGTLQIEAAETVHALPVRGNLITQGRAAVIKENLDQSVFNAGKCFIGKSVEIPFTVRSIGNSVIRIFSFDDLSGYMQKIETPVTESSQMQEIACHLIIPTESLLPEQRNFRLHVQTNCYLENLASHSFEVNCEPVYLLPQPRVLEFVFARRESRQLAFVKAYRSDGEKVKLAWIMSDGLNEALHVTQESNNSLRLEADGHALPPEGELQGELLIEDANSGLIETIPCHLSMMKISHAVAHADSSSE